MILQLNKRSLLFIKYLGYYALILFIPLILLGSLIFYVYLDVLETEIEKNNMDLVEMNRNSIDKEFTQIYSIYYQLYADSAFTKRHLQDDPINAVKVLSNYDSINDFIRTIVISIKDGKSLYTSYGTQSLESFLADAYSDVFCDWDENTFLDRIHNVVKPVIKPAIEIKSEDGVRGSRSVALMLPLPPESKKPDRTVIFLLDNAKMLSALGADMADKDEDFIVLDSQKALVCSLSGNNYSTNDEVMVFINKVEQGRKISGTIDIENKRNLIFCTSSNVTGMYYIRILPEKQALGQLYQARDIFFYTSLIIIVIGGVLILVNFYNSINPIAQLMNFSEKFIGNNKIEEKKSTSIKKAVGEVLRTYDKMESQLNKSIPAVKEHILGKILHGAADEADMSTLPDKGFSLEVTSKQYFTSVISILNLSSVDERRIAMLMDFIEGLLVNSFEGYCKSVTGGEKLVLILCVEEWNRNSVEKELTALRTALFEGLQLETVIGVGDPYDNLSDIGRSYVEANSALDYMLVQGTNSIIFWGEVSKQDFDENVWYPKAELEKLESYILQWDSQKIEETVNCIFATVKEKKISLSIAKCISYDIINIAVKGLNRLKSSLNHQEKINLNIFSLTETKTLNELSERIVSLSRKINEFMQAYNQASSDQLMNAVLDYVNSHCYKNSFTVEGIEGHFSVSPVQLRTMFKKATGSNILSYVNSLRIEKAKELLRNTDMGLEDIVRNIGYLDTSSFVRKFKQETGVTPGDFRKLNRT